MENLQDEFIGWQCRLRKEAVRTHGGRPSNGMRPAVARDDGSLLSEITVLLLERDPARHTDAFRHIVRQTPDPKKRYDSAIKLLGANYYMDPGQFSGTLTAQFEARSSVAAELLESGHCVLAFAQGARAYALPCRVEGLDASHPEHQATYWHNHLFNPDPPAEGLVVGFHPRWEEARGQAR